MDVFVFVIFVVLIGCGSGVLNNYLKNQRERQKHAVNEDVVDELSALRERIEVLERIVTDENYHLSKALDQLASSLAVTAVKTKYRSSFSSCSLFCASLWKAV